MEISIKEWIGIASGVVGFLATTVPMLLAIIRNWKLKTVAEKTNVLLLFMKSAIVSAENNFLKQNTALKSVDPSLSLGSIKKQIVMGQVIAKANELKIKIDPNEWSEKIDNEVKDSTLINNTLKTTKPIRTIIN